MARADILSILYSREKSPLEFKFDSLWGPPLLSLLPIHVIEQLRAIATSVKLAAKIKEKYSMIQKLVEPFGFRKFHAGTNRVIYRHLEYTDIVLKIAIDEVGMKDNPREFYNQQFLKPFVSKTYEVSPCGTVAISERVEPVTSLMEFQSIAEDVFDLLVENIIGEYILEDIGTKYFRNWGLRKGFGPVLLDYPYMFRLDGNRLYCNNEDPDTHQICGGVIDYDAGFNKIVCTQCGKEFLASELQQEIKENKIEMKQEDLSMKVSVVRGNQTLYSNEVNETRVPQRNKFNSRERKNNSHHGGSLRVSVSTSYFDSESLVNVRNEQQNNKSMRIKEKAPDIENRRIQIDMETVSEPKTGRLKPEVKRDKVSYNVTSDFMKPSKEKEEPVHEKIEIDADKLAESMMKGMGVTEEEIQKDYSKHEEEKVVEVAEEQEEKTEYEEYRDENIQTSEKIKKRIMDNF